MIDPKLITWIFEHWDGAYLVVECVRPDGVREDVSTVDAMRRQRLIDAIEDLMKVAATGSLLASSLLNGENPTHQELVDFAEAAQAAYARSNSPESPRGWPLRDETWFGGVRTDRTAVEWRKRHSHA